MYIMKILKFISFTILISVFSFLTINSANALPPCSIEPTGLNCLSEKYSKTPSIELCNKIIQTYNKGAFKCCGRKKEAPPIKAIDPARLTQLVDYVTFKDYPLTKYDSEGKAMKFSGETKARTKAGMVMFHNVTDTDFFKREIEKRYKAFVETYHCIPKITPKNYKTTIPFSKHFKSKTKNAYLWEENELFKKGDYSSARKWSSYPFCSDVFYKRSGLWYTVDPKLYNCPPLILDNYYADNDYRIYRDILDPNDEKNKDSIKCIKSAIANTVEVAKIKIESSANTLNNADPFCKKDFISLSRKRAETAKEAIIKSFPGYTMINANTEIELDYSGRNGDGTSGPCAYYLETDKEDNTTIMGDSRIPGLKTILDPNKYVRITIYFRNKKSASTTASPPKRASYEMQMCREIYFNCSDSNTGNVPSGIFAIKE